MCVCGVCVGVCVCVCVWVCGCVVFVVLVQSLSSGEDPDWESEEKNITE